MKTGRLAFACLLACGLMLGDGSLRAQPPQAEKPPAEQDLAKALIGAWTLVGEPGNVGEPKPGARMKFWGAKHWTITQADANTGSVVFHHGGTYTLEGNKYTEKITFANENTVPLIGREFQYTIQIEGDTYTQIGVNNSYNEVWKRLDK